MDGSALSAPESMGARKRMTKLTLSQLPSLLFRACEELKGFLAEFGYA